MQAGISVFSLRGRSVLLLPSLEELPSIAGSALKTRSRQSWDSSKHTCICTAGTGWQARHSPRRQQAAVQQCHAVLWGFLELAVPPTPARGPQAPQPAATFPPLTSLGAGLPVLLLGRHRWAAPALSPGAASAGRACGSLQEGDGKGSELPTAAVPQAARDGSALLSGSSLSSSPDRLAVLFLGSPRQTLCLVQLWLHRAALSSVYPQYPVCLLRPCTLERQRVSVFLGRFRGKQELPGSAAAGSIPLHGPGVINSCGHCAETLSAAIASQGFGHQLPAEWGLSTSAGRF